MRKPAVTAGFIPCNKVRLVQGGREYFDLLIRLINAAQHSIHLQTYIYDDDETGAGVAAALKRAAQRNVKVYVLADGYASQGMDKKFIHDLRAAGVYFRFFEPLLKNRYFYFGRRLHYKIFTADGTVALVGGINITNRYNDMPGEPAWLDFALLTEGPVAKQFCELCSKTWIGQSFKRTGVLCEDYGGRFTEGHTTLVRVRNNDWVRRRNEISGSYIEMLRKAEKEITIFCSYFLPGRFMRRLLASVAKRGVIIKVVTAGPSDVMVAKYAERWLYDWLLRNNIQLYEYQPTVLHAKIAVCDNEWLTVGSYNINNISAYASMELNADVYSQDFVAGVQEQLNGIIQQHCLPITPAFHRSHKNILRQLLRWLSYEIIRFIFFMVTFYYKPGKE